jgi:hypothetical protein
MNFIKEVIFCWNEFVSDHKIYKVDEYTKLESKRDHTSEGQ